MGACPQTRTVELPAKQAGADNVCFVDFAISEVAISLWETNRRAPAAGLHGGRTRRRRTVTRSLPRVYPFLSDLNHAATVRAGGTLALGHALSRSCRMTPQLESVTEREAVTL